MKLLQKSGLKNSPLRNYFYKALLSFRNQHLSKNILLKFKYLYFLLYVIPFGVSINEKFKRNLNDPYKIKHAKRKTIELSRDTDVYRGSKNCI